MTQDSDDGDGPPRRPTRKLDEDWDQAPAQDGPSPVAGTIETPSAPTTGTPNQWVDAPTAPSAAPKKPASTRARTPAPAPSGPTPFNPPGGYPGRTTPTPSSSAAPRERSDAPSGATPSALFTAPTDATPSASFTAATAAPSIVDAPTTDAPSTAMPDTPSASTPGAPTRAWLDVPTAPTGPTPTGAAPTPAWSDAPSGLAYPAYTPPATPDEPLLPASYNENELRAAVGATPRAEAAPTHRAPTDDGDDDDDIGARRGSRKTVLVGATTLIIGLAIAGIVILGRVNSDRYVLTCDAERAVPEQGRSFPPWGTHAMSGDQWKPIKLPPEADCRRQEPASETALESVYLAMLVDRATALLATKPPADPDAAKIDEAEAVLKQALLLARVPEGAASEVVDERHKSKSEIERMLGDVTYWRAAAKLHEAANALGEAAKQFDAAAAQKSHVSDAAGRAAYTRKLVDELNGTPNAGVTPPPMPATPEHEAAPVGTALPIEPEGSAAGPPLPTPDAGVPSGGVLL